jgi:hypothetical protein
MAQILTKPGQGSLGWAEFADAIFDPANAIRSYLDFVEGAASLTLSATSGTATVGAHYTGTSVHTSSNLGTATVGTAHGGTLVLTHNASAAANDVTLIGSNSRFLVLSAGRRMYFEARVTNTAVTNTFAVGLTSTPSANVFSGANIAVPADSIMIGRDGGTDSLTGFVANRTLQLCVRGSTGAMSETALVIPSALSSASFYRIGFYVDGRNVQAYINGLKVGSVVQYDNTSGTPAAMGWQVAALATTSSTPQPLTVDYIAVSGTR